MEENKKTKKSKKNKTKKTLMIVGYVMCAILLVVLGITAAFAIKLDVLPTALLII